MNQSPWIGSFNFKNFPSLEGNARTEVLVIGGGLCGVLCAYFLQQQGIDCILVEKNRIGCGVTGNTTAKITSQHGLIYSQLIKSVGREKTLQYLNANQAAVEKYRKLASKIDCDFEEQPAYVYTLSNRLKIETEVKTVNELGYPACFVESEELPLSKDILTIEGAIKFPEQGQFNPLKFLAKISENLKIYENTFVEKVEGHRAFTSHGNIVADQIIVATHFPFLNMRGSYFLKLYQSRSYVTAYENVPDVGGMYIDEDKEGISLRNYNGLLFIGGGAHPTGKKGADWQEIKNFVAAVYPMAKPVYEWATQDCMSLDGIPYIGHYSAKTPNLFVATGFNKWGMTSCMVAATILSDMIVGKNNENADVFSPSRSILKPQLLINSLRAAVNLVTPTTPRCTHMGCALKWNADEHTWDCPCHGSRFAEEGDVIDNPAQKNLSN